MAAALPGGIPKRPSLELILRGERHSLQRDAAAIRYHYDVGNEFFGLFLDESMTYSCAVYSKGAETLEQAQLAKLDLIASKLELQPGMRLLDVGCGWGSFAIHAAKHYGATVTGVTLSPSQAELAREKVAQAGLERAGRDPGGRLPRAAGWIVRRDRQHRHVRARRREPDRQLRETLFGLLRPGGVLLNHAIAALDPEYDSLDDEFSMRYVFPDGEALPLSRVQLAVERAGFHVNHVEGFREDYARTLREWTKRLDENLARAEQLAGVERTRVWRLYLRAARHGFDTSITAVYQVRARKPIPGSTADPV